MPLIDAKLLIAEDYDMTGLTFGNDENLTNVIDFGAGELPLPPGGADVEPDVGAGGDMELNIICTEDFDSAGAPASTFTILASAAEALSTPDTLHTFTTDKTPNAGDILCKMKLPAWPVGKRYLGINHDLATANYSAGKISAWIDTGGLR